MQPYNDVKCRQPNEMSASQHALSCSCSSAACCYAVASTAAIRMLAALLSCLPLSQWPSSCSNELAEMRTPCVYRLCRRVALRVSARTRRGAAAYGDVASCHFGARTQEKASSAVAGWNTQGILHRILCRARWHPGILGNTLLVRLSEKRPFLRDWRTRPPVGSRGVVPSHWGGAPQEEAETRSAGGG